MSQFNVPKREEVSQNNQEIFDGLKSKLGFVPNLYAFYTKSETALGDYLTLQNRKTSLKAKEKEVVNLVVSQINNCKYCLSAHTVVGKMNGFTDAEILEIRTGKASFDTKLDVLAKTTKAISENKGRISNEHKENFFEAGYSEESLVDLVIVIGDKTISNYIHNLADFAIDFPEAQELQLEELV